MASPKKPTKDPSTLGGRVKRYAQVSAGLSGVAARTAGRLIAGKSLSDVKNASDITRVLGGLRGPLMKAAQLAAGVPDAMPADFAAELSKLQNNAPPMGPGFVRRRMAAELGPDWLAKFKSFEMGAAHAASLGQVHRAVAKDGRLLACKLQYPDMQSAVDADIRQLKTILAVQRTVERRVDTTEIGEEVAARLREELDYELEAAHMRLYGAILKGRSDIMVPEHVAELSTAQLLTMSWLEGKPLLGSINAEEDIRNRAAQGLFDAWWLPMARFGAIHGDPHLGNYTLRPNGGINLFDFGCVRTFTPEFVSGVIDLYRAVRDKDDDLAADAYRRWGFGKITKELVDTLNIWAKFIYAPLVDDQVRNIAEGVNATEYGAKQVEEMKRRLRAIGGVKPPRQFVFMGRAAVGLGAALLHLKARLNFHRLFEEKIEDFSVASVAKRQTQAFKAAGVPLPTESNA